MPLPVAITIASAGSNNYASAGSNNHASAGSNNHASAGSNNKSSAGSSNHASAGSNNKSSAGSSNHASAGSNNHASAGSSNHASVGSNNHSSAGICNQNSASNNNHSSAGNNKGSSGNNNHNSSPNNPPSSCNQSSGGNNCHSSIPNNNHNSSGCNNQNSGGCNNKQMSQAVNDTGSICVNESVCGSVVKVYSSTTASGNLLSNDLNLNNDPSTISSISDSKNPNGISAKNGQIIIDGQYGTLTVNAQTGDYNYVLDKGVTPPQGATDVFNYILSDCNGCSSNANLTIDLSVNQVQMSQAVDDTGSICVNESVCGSVVKVYSSTTASGNLLANDLNLNNDPSTISSISDSKNPNGISAKNGQIIIDGQYGTLTVNAQTGDYNYVLDKGVTPPQGATDVFNYILSDCNGCSSNANLTIDLSVNQVQMSQAVDDTGSICVNESVCGSVVKVYSSTTASGNLLSNDLNLNNDPSTISSISDSKNPNGISAKNGQIIIDGQYGTLTVNAQTGDYNYVLDKGVTPPQGATDVFNYILSDCNGCSSNANLTIDLSVNQVQMSQAVDDTGSICVNESVCGSVVKVYSSTTASGNLLSNDLNLNNDPSTISSISDSKNPNGISAKNGQIIIDGQYGTLTVNAQTGDYNYVLDKGVTPPQGATDVFNYILSDCNGCSSNANLTIDLSVNQVQMSQAVDDTGSICVNESVCGSVVKVYSSTTASGNLLSNDLNLNNDPSTISKISDSKNPNGVSANNSGQIIIDGQYGTLTVNAQTGDYNYVLDKGVTPPQGATDVFNYILSDCNGCSSNANLTIDLSVNQVQMSQAVDDTGSICVNESVCGSVVKVYSSTTASGNLLANDLNLNNDPSTISSISDSKNPNGISAKNGQIIIDGQYGTLTVNAQTGDYNYVLDKGVTPPQGATDVFNYILSDCNGCSSNANLTIDLSVNQVQMSQAVDDTGSICVNESVCGSVVKVYSSTTASGNLLSNDLNLNNDPSTISSISDSKNPNGISAKNGQIIIDGQYGTLTVNAQTGDYNYVLDKGVTPPQGATDVFNYILSDCNGCSSNANLTIDLSVNQVQMSQAVDDTGSICVNESVCGSVVKVYSSTTASGNLLANDLNLNNDPSTISSISDSKNPNGISAKNGQIIIDGQYGTLTVNAQTGDYNYVLDKGVTPPQGATDVFNYILSDCNGCSSNANLTIDLSVNQVQMSQAVDDTGSICVNESVCGSVVKVYSSTTASGNLLSNDLNLNNDPSTISSISDSKNPNGISAKNGQIIIDGQYGTLTVNAQTGDYNYVLDKGVTPPQGATDVFNYILSDCNGCSSNANLTIDLSVNQVQMSQAVDDTGSICVNESVCGSVVKVYSSTTASGNLLANDLNLNNDPSTISSISDSKNPNGISAKNGQIIIDGQYGTLTVNAQTGDYNYVLDKGATPPQGATDVFNYILSDCNGCSSNANLTIDLSVNQVQMSQAVDDTGSICVNESVCGSVVKVYSSTTASGNLLSNDLNLNNDPSTISSISDSKNPNGISAKNGQIIIDGQYGTLTVNAQTGDYNYVLDKGATPPQGATDVFNYILSDCNGCSSNANLTIDLSVNQVQMSQAVDDTGSICVNESVCGSVVKVYSSTTASGNLLSNDLNLNNDPSTISKISDSKNPNGVSANNSGQIIIDGQYGTLTVNAKTGAYTYILDNGATPPKGATDIFNYTLSDCNGCSSNANLTIDLSVNQVQMSQAVDDTGSICVNESVCGSVVKVYSSTTASGNLLSNDLNLNNDPSTISKISDSKNPNGVSANNSGQIIIDGQYGTLTVNAKTGAYTYILDNGATPPKGATDIFNYTLSDCNGCSSNANLTIDLSINQVQMSQAVNDCGSICVTESISNCGSPTKVISSTTATGNLLSNDTNLNNDPSIITKISDSKNPNGVTANNGQIVINGTYGILTVYTQGADAGNYSYVLDSGVVPPKGSEDVFNYTLTDANGCSSTAELTIALNVTQIQAPPQGDDDDHHHHHHHHHEGGSNPPSHCGDHGENQCGDHKHRPPSHDGHHDKDNGCGDHDCDRFFNRVPDKHHHDEHHDHDSRYIAIGKHHEEKHSHDNICMNMDKDKNDHHESHEHDNNDKSDHHHGNEDHGHAVVGDILHGDSACQEYAKDCKVASFSCYDHANNFVECMTGQTIHTKHGGDLTINENGQFSYINKDSSKSFHEYIECSIKNACGVKDKISFGIHTDDINGDHHSSHHHSCEDHGSDYIVDISELNAHEKLSMNDLNLNLNIGHSENGGSKNQGLLNSTLGSEHAANDCSSACQGASSHAPSACQPCEVQAINQHLEHVHHEIHVIK